MRSRVAHFACLLLLLSSLAVSDVRAGSAEATRTPGGVFVRNLLMQVSDDADAEPGVYHDGYRFPANGTTQRPLKGSFAPENAPSQRTAKVHAVTGSGL